MKLITKAEIMEASANLLGKTSLPNGELKDWSRFAQASLDYCWRYHLWQWSLKRGSLVDKDGNVLMPEDFDYSGFRQIDGVTEASIFDGGNSFYLQFHEGQGRYEAINGTAGTALVYQVQPPQLDDTVKVPFPSAITIAIGMTVYAKQGENPNKANVQQEWDSFHVELDKLVSLEVKNSPRPQGKSVNRQTRQSTVGEFTGKVV